jgi:pyruvate dehydrogenase E1 component alpha subunit
VTEAALLDEGDLDAVDRGVEGAVDNAVRAARAAEPPPLETLLTDVYVRYA